MEKLPFLNNSQKLIIFLKPIQISLEDLKLDQINVIFPGDISFKLSEKIQAIGLPCLIQNDTRAATI